jgi:hypothetical protein
LCQRADADVVTAGPSHLDAVVLCGRLDDRDHLVGMRLKEHAPLGAGVLHRDSQQRPEQSLQLELAGDRLRDLEHRPDIEGGKLRLSGAVQIGR